MKKILTLSLLFISCYCSFAQRIQQIHAQPASVYYPVESVGGMGAIERVTAAGDTFKLSHIPSSDTIVYYKIGVSDSGYVTGTNNWGDKAFAERYTINGTDSSVQVIGVYALFGGKVKPGSTQKVTFNIWDAGAQKPITATLIYNGFPNNVLDSVSVPVTGLGIGTTIDTVKKFMFATPSPVISSSFFAGYSISYTFDTSAGATTLGDNIALASSKNGERIPAGATGLYSVDTSYGVDTTSDTLLNVQNATLGADNAWYDNYTQNDSLKNNLAIYPIVLVGNATGVTQITRNGFTFLGAYPNPATSVTHISFSLFSNADVSVQLMDMAGRVVSSAADRNLAAGRHSMALATDALPAGDYLYLVRTSAGDGIAGKLTLAAGK